MAKKVAPKIEPVEVPEEKIVQEPVDRFPLIIQTAKNTPGIEICDHVNRQRPDGKSLICSLPKGHGGDHSCPFGDGQAIWSDAAGTPL